MFLNCFRVLQIVVHLFVWEETRRRKERDTLRTGGLHRTWIHMLWPLWSRRLPSCGTLERVLDECATYGERIEFLNSPFLTWPKKESYVASHFDILCCFLSFNLYCTQQGWVHCHNDLAMLLKNKSFNLINNNMEGLTFQKCICYVLLAVIVCKVLSHR